MKKKLEETRKKNEILENNMKKLKVSLQSSNTMNENNNRILKEKVNLAKFFFNLFIIIEILINLSRELLEKNEKMQENDKKSQQKIKDLKLNFIFE